jgi:hypothetical protein
MAGPEQYKSVQRTYSDYAAEDKIYLHRVFRCAPGEARRFAGHYEKTIDARQQVSSSLVPVGAWQTVYGPHEDVLHIYEFDSLAAMQADLDLLLESRAPGAPVPPGVTSQSSKVTRRLPYCPEKLIYRGDRPQPDNRISMLMAVYCTRSGVGDFIEHFASGIEQRKGLADGLTPVGAWRNLYGGRYYELNHIYSFESLADMEESRRMMYRDEQFLNRVKINTSPLPPNFWEWGGASELLKPLAYSRMR